MYNHLARTIKPKTTNKNPQMKEWTKKMQEAPVLSCDLLKSARVVFEGAAVALFQAPGPWSGMLGWGKRAPASPSWGMDNSHGDWSSQQDEQDSSSPSCPTAS